MACTKENVKSNDLNFWTSETTASVVPDVDIIAVQGLGADPFYTWVKKVPSSIGNRPKRARYRVEFWKDSKSRATGGGEASTEESTEVMWLRDLLPPLFKNARIASYSYKSDWRDPSVRTNLRECANQFLNILYQHRRAETERQRPIVLIGHSLGCLVIQQALVIAVHQREFSHLRFSVAGIIFLGGPLQGSDTAMLGTWLAQLSGLDSTLLAMLRTGSSELYALATDFYGSYSDWDIVCFYERKEANYLGLFETQVVSAQSASLLGKRSLFLDTDHSGLNKFSSQDDENFVRVLPEIQRMVEDGPSIVHERFRLKGSDAAIHGNIHWMVPRTVNKLFTGRDDLLLRIQTALESGHKTAANEQRRFVITGIGGQGKSEVCLKIADLMREKFWAVFWVDVSQPSAAERSFIAIAETIGRSVESFHDALRVLSNTKQNWLLILDNADDPSFDYQDYLPSGNRGAIIITSRIPNCSRYSPDAFEALEALDDQQAHTLLCKAAEFPEDSWPSYSTQTKEVIRILGSHTLALIQAGAYIARGHCRLHQYPQIYRKQRKRLLEFRPEQAKSRYCDVYATFEASAYILEQSQSQAADDSLQLLGILSMLDSSVLPLQIFEKAWEGCEYIPLTDSEETGDIYDLSSSHVDRLPRFIEAKSDEWDPYRLVEAVALLASLSLVTRHDADNSLKVSMHPLTHAWARDRQDPKQQGVAWIATGCVLALSRSDRDIWRIEERRLLPHTQSYLDVKIGRALSFGSQSDVVPILLGCGWALKDMRQDSRLGSLLEDMFVELGKSPEEPAQESLPLYLLHERSLSNLGKNREAAELLEQILIIQTSSLAEDHLSRLTSQHQLAGAYQANGQVKEAVEMLEQVVNIQATALAKDHPDRLVSQHALASAYLENGQVKEAVEMLEQVVNIRATALAKDHPNQLASQHELARAYLANGHVKEAVEMLEQVVNIQATALAKDHPNQLASQHELARAYLANGQVKEAVEMLEQVVKIKQSKWHKSHPSRVVSEELLADVLENV